jgi:tetratricopeptide (TPR) repeat protein
MKEKQLFPLEPAMLRGPVFHLLFCLAVAAPSAAAAADACAEGADAKLRIEACASILEREGLPAFDRFNAYVNRARAYQEMQLGDPAVADYTRAIELARNAAIPSGARAQAYANRGVIYYNAGKRRSAFEDFNQALEADPANPGHYLNRGQSRYIEGDTAGAIADYAVALKLYPNFGDAYFNRGLAYARAGDQDKAIEDFARVIVLNPGDAEAHLNRGISYFALADFYKADAEFTQAVKLDTNPYFPLWRYLAEGRRGLDAAPQLEAAIKRIRSRLWPYPAIEVYLGKTDRDAALLAAIGTVQQCEANFYFGELSILHGKPADAEASLKKAAELCAQDVPQFAMSAEAELKRLMP